MLHSACSLIPKQEEPAPNFSLMHHLRNGISAVLIFRSRLSILIYLM